MQQEAADLRCDKPRMSVFARFVSAAAAMPCPAPPTMSTPCGQRRHRGPSLTWNTGVPNMFIFQRSPIPPLVGIIIILSGVLLTHQRNQFARRLPETPCSVAPAFREAPRTRMRDFARLQRQTGRSVDRWIAGRL